MALSSICDHDRTNALSYALKYEELDYAEGWAYSGVIPAHHAWCVTDDGRVVDPTWRDVDATAEYVGIRFPKRIAAQLSLDFKHEPLLTAAWLSGTNLL